jgi:hypothetical protein
LVCAGVDLAIGDGLAIGVGLAIGAGLAAGAGRAAGAGLGALFGLGLAHAAPWIEAVNSSAIAHSLALNIGARDKIMPAPSRASLKISCPAPVAA